MNPRFVDLTVFSILIIDCTTLTPEPQMSLCVIDEACAIFRIFDNGGES